MIITRTPLRISLGGGGTDLPSYYQNAGSGFLVAAAISKFVFIAVNRNFDEDLLLKYSKIEKVANWDHVRHPILRECLSTAGIQNGIEISSMADIPAGTGLGSSGSFTVGVLKALLRYDHKSRSNLEIAQLASHIEMVQLSEPVGKQDHYISAIGGVTAFTFHDDERVDVEPLALSIDTREKLDDNLLLFYTGIRRSASEVLLSERDNPLNSGTELRRNLDLTKEFGLRTRECLTRGDLTIFGALLTEQWGLKYHRQPSVVHDQVDEWIRRGIRAGAYGGKLVGAGGGGFLLFYAEEKARLRSIMRELGLPEVVFRVDYDGSSVIAAS